MDRNGNGKVAVTLTDKIDLGEFSRPKTIQSMDADGFTLKTLHESPPPPFRGGQGRSAEDVEASGADLLALLVGIGLAVLLGLVIVSLALLNLRSWPW